jgi:Tfp pilus assembly protein PilN
MKVNLLPYEAPERRGANLTLIFALTGILLLAGATFIFYAALEGRVTAIQGQIADIQQEYEKYGPALERRAYLDRLEAAIKQKSAFIEELSGQGVKWNRIMDELRDIIPQTVVLDAVTNSEDGVITIVGRAGSLQAISQYMENIRRSEYVTAPGIKRVSWNTEFGAFEFIMTCRTKAVSDGG